MQNVGLQLNQTPIVVLYCVLEPTPCPLGQQVFRNLPECGTRCELSVHVVVCLMVCFYLRIFILYEHVLGVKGYFFLFFFLHFAFGCISLSCIKNS